MPSVHHTCCCQLPDICAGKLKHQINTSASNLIRVMGSLLQSTSPSPSGAVWQGAMQSYRGQADHRGVAELLTVYNDINNHD